jgi:predicted nuclease with TOPRIM domain
MKQAKAEIQQEKLKELSQLEKNVNCTLEKKDKELHQLRGRLQELTFKNCQLEEILDLQRKQLVKDL